jgi:hypothetical protein
MKYYKVPKNLDGRAVLKKGLYCGKIQRFLIVNELYTKKELEKYGMTIDGFIEMDIPKNRVFHNFGVRFEKKD